MKLYSSNLSSVSEATHQVVLIHPLLQVTDPERLDLSGARILQPSILMGRLQLDLSWLRRWHWRRSPSGRWWHWLKWLRRHLRRHHPLLRCPHRLREQLVLLIGRHGQRNPTWAWLLHRVEERELKEERKTLFQT